MRQHYYIIEFLLLRKEKSLYKFLKRSEKLDAKMSIVMSRWGFK